MRKITSKYKEEKKKKRNAIAIGIVLIAIMFFSILGYSFQGKSGDRKKKIKFNDFEFENINNFWVLNMNKMKFSFMYSPYETEKIEGDLRGINNYYGKPLYVHSENNEAEAEIYRNFAYNSIVERMQNACIEGEKCEGDFPIKSCEDNFIIIKESNKTEIYQENNCVFIESPKEEMLKTIDGFLFDILGIQ
ncbi:MAG: hypothetical protein P8X70_01945 [Nanoarchaeota archaeon]